MDIINTLLIIWVIYTIIKDKIEWLFIKYKIQWILCFYCIVFWSYLLTNNFNIKEAALASFISYWYIKIQDYIKIKLRK